MRSKITLGETKKRYEKLRRIAHDFTEKEFKAHSVKLTEISHKDVVEADVWSGTWDDSSKIPTWEWKRMYEDYRSNTGLKRFDTALIMNGQLCALCYGVPTKSKLTLKIHAISRNPYNNPLKGKVLEIILFAANAYARLLGADELWICNPMNSKLVKVYERAGYEAKKNKLNITTHLSLRLTK
jgi:hypothetical protein